MYRLLKRDPSNKAARALGVKLQGQIHARSRQTIAAEVEASLVKEKKDAEKAEMEAKKKAAAAASGRRRRRGWRRGRCAPTAT